MPLASGAGVQGMVDAVGAVVEGFAVSSAAVAWSYRRMGEQPELHVMQWNGQATWFPTAITVEHVAVDATTIYWIDAGTLVRASLATGAKIVGPSIAGQVRRLVVEHGAVYAATDQGILRLAANGSWATLAREDADDLAVAGSSVYWTSTARGTVGKVGARAPVATFHQPRALAVDGASLFVAADDPLVIERIAPR